MVLTSVDLPRPVCPTRRRRRGQSEVSQSVNEGIHTNTHDIELETTLQQLPLDLGGDAVETDMAVGEDGGLLTRSSTGSGGHDGKLGD